MTFWLLRSILTSYKRCRITRKDTKAAVAIRNMEWFAYAKKLNSSISAPKKERTVGEDRTLIHVPQKTKARRPLSEVVLTERKRRGATSHSVQLNCRTCWHCMLERPRGWLRRSHSCQDSFLLKARRVQQGKLPYTSPQHALYAKKRTFHCSLWVDVRQSDRQQQSIWFR